LKPKQKWLFESKRAILRIENAKIILEMQSIHFPN